MSDFSLTADESRAVARFAADCARDLLADFEAEAPDDVRPRAAVEAAMIFADGAPRSNLQRAAAFEAHRAAKVVSSEAAQLAALACGDAAAAAFLHPIAKASQVGHILRAAACAVRVVELADGSAVDRAIDAIARRAVPQVREVLRRYPPPVAGKSRVSQLVSALDLAVRNRG